MVVIAGIACGGGSFQVGHIGCMYVSLSSPSSLRSSFVFLPARIGKGSNAELTPEQKAELKADRKRRADAKAEARKPLDKMVKEEIKRLGRKLTQGEKNACSLKVHHPDLVDVWGDLQKRVKVIKPVTMEAHPSLKLTLLPFQKESLYWMRKQEEGPWKGGMLADESECSFCMRWAVC